jgi:hypothetical protein
MTARSPSEQLRLELLDAWPECEWGKHAALPSVCEQINRRLLSYTVKGIADGKHIS